MNKKKRKAKPEDFKFELVLNKTAETSEKNELGKPVIKQVKDKSRKFLNGYDMWQWSTNVRNWKYEE